jgi:uncharacterized membrane protein
MNLILSLLYAPFIYFSTKYMPLQNVALSVFAVSLIWLLFSIKKGWKECLYPLLYLLFSIATFFIDALFILKALPVIISIIIASVFLISYIKNESIIFYFAKKFRKTPLSEAEIEYIRRSTLFWVFTTLVNVAIHLYALFGDNLAFWAFYGSIGGYGLIALAGVLQFLHKKLIFERGK